VEHALLFNGVSKGLIDLLPLAHAEKHFLRLTSLLGIDRSTGVPEDAISRDVSLGSCWPMDGQRGYITILLQQEIMVESISIQHVSRQEATDIRSAPHEFSVFGARDDDGGPGDHLLEGAYSINGPAKQTFHVKEPRPIRSIKVDISSNHGHLEYTCLYKVAVHGVLF
jgi:SUN domain-containing protein 1/2